MNAMSLGEEIMFWTMVVEIGLAILLLIDVGTANPRPPQPRRRLGD